MSFTGHEDHSISLTVASDMTENYRDNNVGEILGGFFGRDAIEAILAQTECVGIRYYYGETSNGDKTMILVGAKANQDDIVDGELAEYSKPNPPFVSSSNSLNS